MWFSTLCPVLVACTASAQLVVEFDNSPKAQISKYVKAEEVIGSVYGERKTQTPLPDSEIHRGAAVISRDNNAAAASSDLLGKRQGQYCDAGYAYCANFGRCCPTGDRCCPFGYCLEPQTICCPSGPCRDGELCCGAANCSPIGSECCRDGSHCEPGNHCYYDPYRGPVCCTNSLCTAYVQNGVTISAARTTTQRTYTITSTQYYYWTITWYYYSYYWTYSVQIEASIVTSTRATETTTYSVRTTDAAAASQYFLSVSSTLTLPTPAAATSLADMAGETSYVSGSAAPSQGNFPQGDDTAGDDNSGDGNSGDGGGSGAVALWSGFDHPTTAFLIFGLSVGILAVVL